MESDNKVLFVGDDRSLSCLYSTLAAYDVSAKSVFVCPTYGQCGVTASVASGARCAPCPMWPDLPSPFIAQVPRSVLAEVAASIFDDETEMVRLARLGFAGVDADEWLDHSRSIVAALSAAATIHDQHGGTAYAAARFGEHAQMCHQHMRDNDKADVYAFDGTGRRVELDRGVTLNADLLKRAREHGDKMRRDVAAAIDRALESIRAGADATPAADATPEDPPGWFGRIFKRKRDGL